MKALPGDRLVVDDGDDAWVAVILGSRDRDGSPPYVVRWLADGHITLVFPGPYARIVPSESDPGDGHGGMT